MNPLTPCCAGELGPVCAGHALVDAVPTAFASPSPSVAALGVQAGEPSWYYGWDVAGTWFGALGTIFAAGIATWLGVRAVRDQNAQREEQSRAQASRVILLRSDSLGGVYLTLRNDSDLPISNVRVVSEGALEKEIEIEDHIGPHMTRDHYYQAADSMAVVEFVDAAGRAWIRTIGGSLLRWAVTSKLVTVSAASTNGPVIESIQMQINHGGQSFEVPLTVHDDEWKSALRAAEYKPGLRRFLVSIGHGIADAARWLAR